MALFGGRSGQSVDFRRCGSGSGPTRPERVVLRLYMVPRGAVHTGTLPFWPRKEGIEAPYTTLTLRDWVKTDRERRRFPRH